MKTQKIQRQSQGGTRSARGLAQSKTRRDDRGATSFRQILDCGGPPPFQRTLGLGLLIVAILVSSLNPLSAQVRIINGRPVGMPDMPGGMPSGDSPSSSSSSSSSSGKDATGPWLPAEPPLPGITSTNADSTKNTNVVDEIQLSFQGANVDMIIQWLAATTGKTVLKHPQVQCQLTITSSKKVSPREAIVLVYRALAMEKVSVIESARSIIIVPEGQEPRMSPEIATTNLMEGRQRLVKVFTLQHLQAADLRDRIRIALTDKALVDIDERANQLIITDYNDNIRIVGELIAALDTDKPEDVAVRMLPLKNVGAVQIAREIGPLYQKMSGKSLDVAADERANALIVLSSAASFEAIQKLVASLDTEDAMEKTSETFLLKNADAQDLARQLQELNQSSTVQARYFYSYSGNDSTQKKVSVVADRRRNAVIVQAPPSQMDKIRQMIRELDAPVSDDSLAPKIYQLKYVSAVDIEDVLNELFLKKQQNRSYFDYFFGDDSGGGSSADKDVGRLYGKVRITSEPYSNTLIVTSNSKENLAVVEDVLNQLDRPSEAGESTMRIGLKYAKASTVANSLNILFAKNGSPGIRPATQQNQNNPNNQQQNPQQNQNSTSSSGFNLEQQAKEDGYYPWLGGQPDNIRSGDRASTRTVSDLVGRVRTVADERGNSVLISANVHFFPQILKLIGELDAATDQVSIEARIVEVSTDYLDKLGVRWSPDGSKVFTPDDYENSLLVHGSANYQKGFAGNTTVNSPQSATALQALTSLRSGVVQGSVNMDFLIQFLKKNTDASVIGSPQITINDNETGKLFVGQQVPVPDTTQISSVGSQNTALKYKDVGVVLEVTPHINNTGDVQLKIHAESSTVAGVTFLDAKAPAFDTRSFRTDLTAKNGQTLVLGGIIQRQVSDVQRRTPILGYIPIIEWAFKKQDKSQHQVELMVFLRTKVLHTPDESVELLEDVDRKAPQLKKWQEETLPKVKKRF